MNSGQTNLKFFDKSYGYENLYNDLISDTWQSGYEDQGAYDFKPEILEWWLDPEDTISWATYHDNKIVGLITSLRRRVKFVEQEFVSYLSTLFSVHPNYHRQGIGAKMYMEQIQELIDRRNVPIHFLYLDQGHDSSALLQNLLENHPRYEAKKIMKVQTNLKLFNTPALNKMEPFKWYEKIALVKPIRQWLESFKINDTYYQNIGCFIESDLDACQNLLNSYYKRSDLALSRVWDKKDELLRQLHYQDFVETYVFKRNDIVLGLINFYTIQVRSQCAECTMAIIDNIHIEGLAEEEKESFISYFLSQVKHRGCDGIVMLNFNYFNHRILKKFKFLQYPRYFYLVAIGKKESISQFDKIKNNNTYFDFR